MVEYPFHMDEDLTSLDPHVVKKKLKKLMESLFDSRAQFIQH